MGLRRNKIPREKQQQGRVLFSICAYYVKENTIILTDITDRESEQKNIIVCPLM